MTWGTYYFFYECPQCGKKYRYELEGSADEEFGFCPECHVMGTFCLLYTSDAADEL